MTDEEFKVHFGIALDCLMTATATTGQDLAQSSAIAAPTISRLRTAKGPIPSITTFMSLSTGVRVSPTALMALTERAGGAIERDTQIDQMGPIVVLARDLMKARFPTIGA